MPSLAKAYPTVKWPHMDVTATFVETGGLSALPGGFVVAFAWINDGFLLANIEGRGWCTPSGHIEPNETPLDAAIREVHEEVGAVFTSPIELGRFDLSTSTGELEYVPTYLGHVARLNPLARPNDLPEVQHFSIDQIPSIYYHWDPLLERVFQRAYHTAISLFPAAQTPTSNSPKR